MPAKKADAKGAKGGKGGKAAPSKSKPGASKAGAGGKAKKKKWSKGKVKDKIQRAVIFEGESAHQQALKDVSSMRMITPATVSERLKVNLSLARRTINELVESGAIKVVSKSNSCHLYTKA